MEMMGTDIGNSRTKVSQKTKNGKMWDFNIENQGKEEAIDVDQERQEAEAESEYSTRFGAKIGEVGVVSSDLRFADRVQWVLESKDRPLYSKDTRPGRRFSSGYEEDLRRLSSTVLQEYAEGGGHNHL